MERDASAKQNKNMVVWSNRTATTKNNLTLMPSHGKHPGRDKSDKSLPDQLFQLMSYQASSLLHLKAQFLLFPPPTFISDR